MTKTAKRLKNWKKGKRFGQLTLQKFSHQDKSYTDWWECSCSCGQTTFVRAFHLIDGSSTSCGKHMYINLIGKRFGYLRVLKFCK
jgi:hypothetical protein